MKKIFILIIVLCPILVYSQDSNKPQFPSQPWRMYHVDRQYWNHNSLSPADVNGDGYDDYAVIHEGPDKVTIVFHPGNMEDIYKEWPKIAISEGSNVEYAFFGDLDGDGNLDVAYANGNKADLNVIWGPEKSKVMDPKAWKDGGPLPSSANQGHYVYLETFDVNNDGALDIITGGRRHSSGKLNGLIWFEAPKNKRDRRDLSKWKMNSIDPELKSGHGFILDDFDTDGDVDIVVSNSDWDTPYHENMVLWYENPGPKSANISNNWKKHNIARNQMLFAKAQVGIGDLNKDGKKDVVVQSDNYVFYYEQQGSPDEWKETMITKPEYTRWVTRPIKVADINNDGKLDIVGMTIHNYGYTPKHIASVFWMEFLGDKPEADNWQTHVIKWSDGIFSGFMWQGEKWDHMRFIDLDKDGDLDILANCEEYYGPNKNTLLGVVWFENPTVP